jgi:chemotaxis family two-component system sensor kinase Cph1
MTLLAYDTPIDLTNCDREPIHVPGQIQAHGVLLAVDRQSFQILQVSDNVGAYLALDPKALLGSDVLALFEPIDRIALRRVVEQGNAERAPLHAFCGNVSGARRRCDVIVHTDAALAIIEVEPAEQSDQVAPDFYQFASRTVASLHGTPTTHDYCRALASAIRELSGYDRVMIYRFAEDCSGHVVAESIVEGKGLTPFLDLHYPASDIPAQARALFLKNAVRMLPDAKYMPAVMLPAINPLTSLPLDMSHAFLRGASAMYTEYLVNMGVRASLTMALIDRDRLWGLVACHHYEPRRVSYGVRLVCELLARIASLQIADKTHSDEALYSSRIQSVHTALIEAMARGDNPGLLLAQQTSAARAFVDCGGVAVVSGGEVHANGAVPPVEYVLRIAMLLSGTARDSVVAIDRLSTIYPEAESFLESACGLLALPLSAQPCEYLMWFRPELARSVSWAGDPHKPVTVGPTGDHLTPRKSFERWVETVRGACDPWTRLEIDSAKRLRSSMTELLIRRNQELERLNRELSRSNQELDAFSYSASHDLKEPLRGIYNYAEFLKRDAGERLAVAEIGQLDSILRLTTRMQSLINSLLDYSRLGRIEQAGHAIALGPLVDGVIESLALPIAERNAKLTVSSDLPTVKAVARYFEQIFHNLLTNALKYNDKPSVEIEVGWVRAGDAAFPNNAAGATGAFYVEDNGIGIAEQHRDAAFRIFKRLHARDKYGGGTGAGLTIVKKLVERMGGKIWIESELDVGTVVWFVVSGEVSPALPVIDSRSLGAP